MTGTGGILFLDLSTNVGWAYGLPGQPSPLWGVWVLPQGPDLGRRFASYENQLLDAFDAYRPELVGMEAPLPASEQSQAYTAELLLGLAAITECACYRWEKRLVRRASSTLRAAVIGTGRFPRGEAKKWVLAWCKGRGWNITDHNASDAAVGWAYEVGIRAARPPMRGRPRAVRMPA